MFLSKIKNGANGSIRPNIEEVRRKKLEQDRKEAEKRRKISKKEAERKEKADRPLVSSAGEWEFPSLSLLENKKMAILTDEKKNSKKRASHSRKLLEFGVDATVDRKCRSNRYAIYH